MPLPGAFRFTAQQLAVTLHQFGEEACAERVLAADAETLERIAAVASEYLTRVRPVPEGETAPRRDRLRRPKAAALAAVAVIEGTARPLRRRQDRKSVV